MEQSIVGEIKEELHLSGLDPKSYSPLGLAYIGDAIYEVIIRTIVLSEGNMSVNKYHRKSSSMVKASAQAQLFEQEMAVYKRGRNAKSATVAKNADVIDYRKATGVEALMGYLYLNGEMKRAVSLVGAGLGSGEEHEA